MGIREIPASKVYVCDVCKAEHVSSKPYDWGTLILRQDAYDFQGAAVADATITRLLCSDCKRLAVRSINEAFAQRIEAGTDETPQEARPEGREPDPKDAPETSDQTPHKENP